jgi:hypothetical protein
MKGKSKKNIKKEQDGDRRTERQRESQVSVFENMST